MTLPDDLNNVRDHPYGYGVRDFQSAVAFLIGYDSATDGMFLCGFREWLIVKVGRGNNLAWPGLVKLLAAASSDDRPGDQDSDAFERAVLFRLLEEFLADRRRHDGPRRIFIAHENWLRKQSWYRPGSPDWISSEDAE